MTQDLKDLIGKEFVSRFDEPAEDLIDEEFEVKATRVSDDNGSNKTDRQKNRRRENDTDQDGDEKKKSYSEQSETETEEQYSSPEQDDFHCGNNNNKKRNNKNKNRNKKASTKKEKSDEKETKLKTILAFKYSNKGKDTLHEAIFLNGKPCYVTYNAINDKIEIKEDIQESTRIIRPPSQEEYPYTPYEFENEDELIRLMNQAKEIKSLDPLYTTAKEIFQKFDDQDVYIMTMLPVDCLWTYFQDLFPITRYSEGIGDNDVGKSSIGYTFEYTAYRVVKGTSISGPNYSRLLGFVEPGQCTIVEDEGDSISDDPDKIRLLKSGYEYTAKIPKINMNTVDQAQKWFYGYCYKMILAENSMSQLKAKGLVDRTFTYYCRPGKVKYSIKEVVSDNINKSPKLHSQYKELLDFRKLMLCYRIVHYRDELPQIITNLKNRENELCKPLLQLFYGTQAFDEIKNALEFFVMQRRERRLNSIEAALYPILKEFIYPNKTSTLFDSKDNLTALNKFVVVQYSKIWAHITGGAIAGKFNDNKPNQYETHDYGILFQNTLSKLIADKFGADLDRKPSGSILIFNTEIFDYFEDVYCIKYRPDKNEDDLKDFVKIEVKLESSYDEGNVGNVGNVGCVSTNSKSDSNSNNPPDLEGSVEDYSSFRDEGLKDMNSKNTEDETHSLEPTQPTQPTSNKCGEIAEDIKSLSRTVTQKGTVFYHCPQCKFENIYPEEVLYHMKYTHNNADST